MDGKAWQGNGAVKQVPLAEIAKRLPLDHLQITFKIQAELRDRRKTGTELCGRLQGTPKRVVRGKLLLHRFPLLGRDGLRDEGFGLLERIGVHVALDQHRGALRGRADVHHLLHVLRPVLGIGHLIKLDMAIRQPRRRHGNATRQAQWLLRG